MALLQYLPYCTLIQFVFPPPPHYHEVPSGLLSRGGDVTVYVLDRNQPSLSALFHSVLVSISVFMALSTVFHSMNPPDNSLLSHFVVPDLLLPH